MIDFATYRDKDELKKLWSECFDDTQEFIDNYFNIMFEPCNVIVIRKYDQIVSMATLHQVEYVKNKKSMPCGYVYAVATKPQYRGMGYFKKIMSFAKEQAKKRGYVGLVTVPATQELVKLYRKIGYRTVSEYRILGVSYSKMPKIAMNTLRPCSKQEFINLRQEYLDSYKSYIKLSEKQLEFVYDYVGRENILTADIDAENKYIICEKNDDVISVKEHNFTINRLRRIADLVSWYYQTPNINFKIDKGAKYKEKHIYAMGISFGFRKIKGYVNLMLD